MSQGKPQLTQDTQQLRHELDQTTRDKPEQLTQDTQRLRHELDPTTQDKQLTQDTQRLRHELDPTTRDKQLTQDTQRLRHELDSTTRDKQLTQDTQQLRHELDPTTQDKQLTQDTQRLRHELDPTTQDKQLTQDTQRLRHELDPTTQDKQLTQDTQRLRHELDPTTQDKQLTQDTQRLRHELDQMTRDNRQLTQDTQQLRHELDQMTRDNRQLTQDTQQLRYEVREKQDQIEERERQLKGKESIIAEFQVTLVRKDKKIRDLEEITSTRERDIQEQPKPKQQQKRPAASSTAVDTIKLNWRQCTKAPCGMIRGSVAVDGGMVYSRPEFCSVVHAYDSDKEVWSQMPECPQVAFTLAIVKGLLTAVGGEQSGKPINTLLSLSKRKWSKHFPPMPTKRCETAVVCSGRSLVVAGGWGGTGRGYGDFRTRMNRVEVMDTETLQWFTASSLPHALTRASATICGETLYMLGGWDQSGPTKSVFTCSLSALLQSCIHSLGARPRSLSQEPKVWHTMAAIPVNLSTCTALCGHFLAVGGFHPDYKPSTAIKMYDPVKKSWTVISRMTTPRYLSLVAVLPGDRLMVVGGNTLTSRGYSISDTVEIASVL